MKFQLKIGMAASAVLASLSFGVSAKADAAGDKLLQQVIAKYKTLKTLSATVTLTKEVNHKATQYVETLKMKKPNLFYAEAVLTDYAPMRPLDSYEKEYLPGSYSSNSATEKWRIASDGKQRFEASGADKMTRTLNLNDRNDFFSWDSLWQILFYEPETLTARLKINYLDPAKTKGSVVLTNHDAGTVTMQGKNYRVLEINKTWSGTFPINFHAEKYSLFLGADRLVYQTRHDYLTAAGEIAYTATQSMRKVNLNSPLANTEFTNKFPAQLTRIHF